MAARILALATLAALTRPGAQAFDALPRRRALQSGAMALGALLARPAPPAQAADGTTTFQESRVSVAVPQDWRRSEASMGFRRSSIAYVSPSSNNYNAVLVYTPIRGDYTSLGSFGTINDVARFILPEGVNGRMIGASAAKGGKAYVFDYVVEQPDQPPRRLKTLFTLVGQQVVTETPYIISFTAQALEEDWDKSKDVGATIDSIVSSLTFTN